MRFLSASVFVKYVAGFTLLSCYFYLRWLLLALITICFLFCRCKNCFQLLGFDIIFNSTLHPMVVEVINLSLARSVTWTYNFLQLYPWNQFNFWVCSRCWAALQLSIQCVCVEILNSLLFISSTVGLWYIYIGCNRA